MIQNFMHTKLFNSISEEDIGHLLLCLKARSKEYKNETVVIEEGSRIHSFGILLSGSGRSYKTDAEGNVITITLLNEGSEIGVLLAASPDQLSPVSVAVDKGSLVAFIPYGSLLESCRSNCPCHTQLIRNYIEIVADKGLILHERLDCLLRPTARSKIMVYLRKYSSTADGGNFTIPMDRKAMAEYLNMDRSALSRELSNMKKEHLIDYYKSTFRLYE